jgi:antitoxin component YwqK of YwqJK toxin-antitoxin module
MKMSPGKILLYAILLCGFGSLCANPKYAPQKNPKPITIFVFAPRWSDQQIKSIYGDQAVRLDTSRMNLSVQRIGMAGEVFENIIFNAAYFPNTERLEIYSDQYIPRGTDQFKKLRVLKIGRANVNPNGRMIDTDVPGRIVFSLDSILKGLPILEELYLPDYIRVPIFSEALVRKSSLNVLHVQTYSLPLYIFDKKCETRFQQSFNGVPYPEIAALAISGYDPILFKQSVYIEDDTIPFWVPGSRKIKKPKIVSLPSNGNFSPRYPNGQTILSGSMNNGQPEGEWRFWYSNGQLCELREYRNGRETGLWIYFNEAGDTISTLQFTDAGQFSRFMLSFQDSIDYGIGKPVSHVLSRLEYDIVKNNRTESTRRYYTNNSKDSLSTLEIRSYSGEASLRHKTLYYSGSRLIKQIEYTSTGNISLAVSSAYNLQGHLYSKQISSMGRIIDSVYYNNGVIQEVRVREGDLFISSYWDSTGTKLSDCQFSGPDTLHGVCKYYFSNGGLKSSSNFYKGKMHGSTYLFDELGILIEEQLYENGVLIKSIKKH